MKRWTIAALLLAVACGPKETTNPDTATTPKQPATAAAPKLELQTVKPSGKAEPAPVLIALGEELERAMAYLKKEPDPPYFMAYQATDADTLTIAASLGALTESNRSRERAADVGVRVGTYKFDNHRIFRRGYGYLGAQEAGVGGGGLGGIQLPIDGDMGALKAELWSSTIGHYRQAVQALASAKARDNVTVEQEDDSDDFSKEKPTRYLEAPVSLKADKAALEKRVKAWSARFKKYPTVLTSQVRLFAVAETSYFVNSEGSQVQVSRPHVRVMLLGTAKADDGMNLSHAKTIDVQSIDEIPSDAEIIAAVDKLAGELEQLRLAPVAEPYAGPAILEGRAAAVYFHEVFGHRVEGHRQKNDNEGQTFAKKIGTEVMPTFIDVFDDPTVGKLNGVDLNGHYLFDDEGVQSSRAELVKSGKFVGFLMSRSPTRGFNNSNGHGRRESGLRVAARQGNLIVAPQTSVPPEQLKAQLLERIKKQEKKYGLRFVDISGGVTMTSRYMPQAFQVQPVLVYRVYPDGKEELVRGAVLEGTPLSSLEGILAADSDYEVFNGFCGAESGYVPVAAASPGLLIDTIEVARAPKSQEKPPLLEPPPASALKGGAR